MANIKHALPPETILKNEYHILMPIGKGGFSITYLAECISDSSLVAVKELFNSTYMDRFGSDHSISMRNQSCLSQFGKDRKRFSDEWNVMKQFENFDGIVKPIDCFEENNTAYIVMEHLSGGSMKDIVRTKGAYKPELLLKEVDQVLAVLSEMHRQGYVHGDLSPDNLIMAQDGHYKLIDFGGVRRIGSSWEEDDLLRKEGYTAAEVFNKRGITDPRSDIYSLCAVLYYALTGIAPEDSLERMIADELCPLSESCPELDPLIENIIMKGLSMNPADRWGRIEELQEAILQFNRSEDDRKKEADEINKKRFGKKMTIASSLILAAAFLVFVFCMTHMEFLKFHGEETQKLVFYFDEESVPEKIDTLQNNIEEKIKHIAGSDAYLVKKSGDLIEATIKYSSVEEYNIPVILNKYFNFAGCSIGVDREGNFYEIAEINADNVDHITGKGEYCIITPSAHLLKTIEKYSENDPKFILRISTQDHDTSIWDRHNNPLGGNTYDIATEFDPDNGVLSVRNNEFDHDIEKKLFMDCLSQQAIPINSFNYSRQISWESEQDAFGKNQLDYSQIKGEILLLDYKYDEQGIGTDEMATVKSRLDALEIPYACGHDKNSADHFYLATASADLWEIEAVLLFENIDAGGEYSFSGQGVEGNWRDFYIKSPSGIVIPYIDSETALAEEDGHINVRVTDPVKMQDVVDRIVQNGEDSLYLYIANRPCFKASISSISSDGWITFDETVLDNSDVDLNDARLEHFVNYINTIIANYEYSNYDLAGVQFLNTDKTINWNKDLWDLPFCELYSLAPGKGASSLLTDQSLDITRSSMNPAIINVYYEYDSSAEDKYPHPFAVVRDKMSAIMSAIDISEVNFTIFQRGEYTTIYYMDAYKDPYTGKIQMEWDINYWNHNEDFRDPEQHKQVVFSDREKALDYLASDVFFTANFLYPALVDKYVKTVFNSDDLLIELCVKDTLPGQGYQFAYHVENRTGGDVSVRIEKLAINNIMTNLDGFGGYSFGTSSGGTYGGETFTERELHFPVTQPFRNASIDFTIEYDGNETHKHIDVPGDGQNNEWLDQVTIPTNARLIDETDEYVLYCRKISNGNSISEKDAEFMIVNKAEKYLLFDFTSLDFDVGYDLFKNKSFNPEPAEVMPHSVLYYDLSYTSSWEGDISAYIIQLQVSCLGSNGSLEALTNKEYRIENQ